MIKSGVDRRESWAAISDPELKARLVTQLEKAEEWEPRLEKIESQFVGLISHIEGLVKGLRIGLVLVIAIGGILGSAIVWYAAKRDDSIDRLTEALAALNVSVAVAVQRLDYIDKGKP